MSEPTQRRRQSPAVYRRRRLMVLLVLVAIVAVIWLLIAQPWRGAATESTPQVAPSPTSDAATDLPVPSEDAAASAASESTPTPGSTSSAPSPEASATPAASPCVARDLTVEAVTDQDTYASGQNPLLSIRLTNNGDDCTMNVGTSGQAFTITSGADVWWRSTDCQSEPSDMIVLLAAGQTVESAAPLEWDRTRSSVSTCGDEGRPRAAGGGASYHLSVEIGGVASTETKQIFLH